jgi:GDP-L-fucose synthase
MDSNTSISMNKLHKESPILITGAHGGLGRALVQKLKENGFSNLLTPKREELDLLNQDLVIQYFAANKPAVVLHLASVVFGLLGNMENQILSLTENTKINLNLFSAIEKHTVSYIFSAGTVAGYAYPYASLPLKEQHYFSGLPHSGEFGYAISKRFAYSYLHLLSETKKIRFNYGIFTNLYGENDRFNSNNGHVIPSLIMNAYKAKTEGSAFTVWGDGKATRDFLNFKDAADAILLCMLSENSPSLINISSGKSVTIKFLAELIAKEANLEKINFLQDKPVGISSRIVDNELISTMGFTQSIDLPRGIKELYKWYSENKKISRA